MPSLKTIKTKIKSTGNLKKISRALEIISTIKLQKNKSKVESAKQYFLELAKLIAQVSQHINLFESDNNQSSLKLSWTYKKKLVIVVTSEKGLCWWLNGKITKLLSSQYALDDTDVFVIGKKWYEYCKRVGYTIVWYINLKDEITQSDILPLLHFLEDNSSSYQYISILFNFFHSILSQVASSFLIQPMTQESVYGFLKEIGVDNSLYTDNNTKKTTILLEPSSAHVTKELRNQIKNYLITATVLQNKIAEHAGRMIAMKNAKDNCTSFISKLTLQFNKLRQANITREISEITAAKIAME